MIGYALVLILAILLGTCLGSYMADIVSTLKRGSILQVGVIIFVILLLIFCLVLVGDRIT